MLYIIKIKIIYSTCMSAMSGLILDLSWLMVSQPTLQDGGHLNTGSCERVQLAGAGCLFCGQASVELDLLAGLVAPPRRRDIEVRAVGHLLLL